jgi:hypothetical protein
MTTRRWRPCAGLLALAACGDFTLVEPQPDGPFFSIQIVAVNDESTRYQVSAFFDRGRDADGSPTEVVDRALYIDGTPVLPEPERLPGFWSYGWEETRASDDRAESLRVVLPVIAGSSASALSITIPITRREDPFDINLVRNEDLVLRVSPQDAAPPGLSRGANSWTLEILRTCSGGDLTAPQFKIDGSGGLPPELRVPWQWLEPLSISSTSACLRALSTFEVVGSPYLVHVSVFARLGWRIQIVAPPM